MKLRKESKIEQAAGLKNVSHPCLSAPYLEGDTLVATDGGILAAIRVENKERPDDIGLIMPVACP